MTREQAFQRAFDRAFASLIRWPYNVRIDPLGVVVVDQKSPVTPWAISGVTYRDPVSHRRKTKRI